VEKLRYDVENNLKEPKRNHIDNKPKDGGEFEKKNPKTVTGYTRAYTGDHT